MSEKRLTPNIYIIVKFQKTKDTEKNPVWPCFASLNGQCLHHSPWHGDPRDTPEKHTPAWEGRSPGGAGDPRAGQAFASESGQCVKTYASSCYLTKHFFFSFDIVLASQHSLFCACVIFK